MALQKKGKYYYGDSQLDIKDELLRYSRKNSYATDHYADSICICGNKTFTLLIDDEEGVAVRTCVDCKIEHPIGDSYEYLEDADLEECECLCGSNAFEITVGVSLYQNSEDVRWIYIGCRCFNCGLTGCYGDWKNEYSDYSNLLGKI